MNNIIKNKQPRKALTICQKYDNGPLARENKKI